MSKGKDVNPLSLSKEDKVEYIMKAFDDLATQRRHAIIERDMALSMQALAWRKLDAAIKELDAARALSDKLAEALRIELRPGYGLNTERLRAALVEYDAAKDKR